MLFMRRGQTSFCKRAAAPQVPHFSHRRTLCGLHRLCPERTPRFTAYSLTSSQTLHICTAKRKPAFKPGS